MSHLASLRRRIASLRRWRALMRGAAAWSAVLTALLWGLAGVFAVDVLFELNVAERLLMMAVAAGLVVWAGIRYALPLLRGRESLLQVALLVEQRHAIPSDLVAALQFESPAAAAWGSPQMEHAVIQQVAERGSRLRVFEGFSHPQARRRMLVLLLTLAAIVAVIAMFPEHTRIFGRRLALASDHYPSATRIEAVVVNRQLVLLRSRDRTRPASTVAPEGQPISFRVQVAGRLPEKGEAALQARSGRRGLPLEPVSLEQRREALEDAANRLRAVVTRDGGEQNLAVEEIASSLQFDAPEAAELVQHAAADPEKAAAAAKAVEDLLAEWPAAAGRSAIYEGRLSRLIEGLSYQLYLGDAWTDPADIRMISLPAVELSIDARPPEYAADGAAPAAMTSSRQLSVLEGSEVHVAAVSTNAKPLEAAWLTVLGGQTPQRFELQPDDGSKATRWSLPPAKTPFAQVAREIRFEVQARDRDGLHLETPLRGYVRMKADDAPSCSAGVVHQVVLPSAKPVIAYRVNDDYGIAKLTLLVEIEREGEPQPASVPDRIRLPLLAAPGLLSAAALPLSDEYTLDLVKLPLESAAGSAPESETIPGLEKGDRLKLTLEAIDFRGKLPGQSCLSEPLVLEISDESGVLAAISEADQRSEERLTEIIKQQLGIGGE